jgi:hypothetical protein
MMLAPDWSRLPFKTDHRDWQSFTAVPTADDAINIIKGEAPDGIVVNIFIPAAHDFARRCNVGVERAIMEMYYGVMRWFNRTDVDDGDAHIVRFTGAQDREYIVGRLGRCLLVHLPLEEMRAAVGSPLAM